MGYDLHITRREDWSAEGDDITADEWLEYVHSDPEFRISGINGPYFADWNGRSKHAEPWLNWSSGVIYTKNPDRALVDKMILIAKKLGAKVQGDDGEDYSDSSQIQDPDEASAAVANMPPPQLSTREPLQLTALRLGKRRFIIHYGIIRHGLPWALVLAGIFHIREHGWVFPHSLGEFGSSIFVLLAGSLTFGSWIGLSTWRKLMQ